MLEERKFKKNMLASLYFKIKIASQLTIKFYKLSKCNKKTLQ